MNYQLTNSMLDNGICKVMQCTIIPNVLVVFNNPLKQRAWHVLIQLPTSYIRFLFAMNKKINIMSEFCLFNSTTFIAGSFLDCINRRVGKRLHRFKSWDSRWHTCEYFHLPAAGLSQFLDENEADPVATEDSEALFVHVHLAPVHQ